MQRENPTDAVLSIGLLGQSCDPRVYAALKRTEARLLRLSREAVPA